MQNILVSADWLKEHLDKPEIVILDARLRYDATDSDMEDIRVKGARIFDLENEFSDKNSPFPNMLPSSAQFEISCRKLGINKSSKIVVYDHFGIYISPRVWWMFKVMGHDNVSVLIGGFPEWDSKGYVSEKGIRKKVGIGNFKAHFNPELVVDYEQIKYNIEEKKALVIDVRSSDRFLGLVPEPRKELRRGNIPNSINMPYETVLKDGKYKSENELKEIFSDLNKEGRPLVFSCGSGVTACIVLLASEMTLGNTKKVYDGSWTEYAQVAD